MLAVAYYAASDLLKSSLSQNILLFNNASEDKFKRTIHIVG